MAAHGFERAREGFGGDGVKLAFDGQGTGGDFGIEIFQDKLGEEMRLVEAIELRAEAEEADRDGAKADDALGFPLAGEGEAGVHGVAGFGGDRFERKARGLAKREKVTQRIAEARDGL